MVLQLLSFPILFSLLLFVFMVLNISKRSRTNTKSTSKLPPGPRKLPLIGNLHQLLSPLSHHALRDLAKKYGPLMYIRIGQVPTLVVSSPKSAKEVLRTHDVIFAFWPLVLSSQIVLYNSTDIIFSLYGVYWRQMQKICTQELLSAARVQSFKLIREEEMLNLVKSIASNVGSTINLTERIHSSTYTIIARAAFGKKCKDQEEFIPVEMETLKIGSGFDFADMFPSLSFLDPLIFGTRAKLEKLHRKCDRLVENIINKHKMEKPKEESGDQDAVTEDLVDVLIKFHNNDLGSSLTIDNIKAKFLVSIYINCNSIMFKYYDIRNFEFIPFGAGRRICPGMSFGLINVKFPLTMLLYHFDWKLPNGIKNEELDMTELFGAIACIKNDLHLIPTAYDRSYRRNDN